MLLIRRMSMNRISRLLFVILLIVLIIGLPLYVAIRVEFFRLALIGLMAWYGFFNIFFYFKELFYTSRMMYRKNPFIYFLIYLFGVYFMYFMFSYSVATGISYILFDTIKLSDLNTFDAQMSILLFSSILLLIYRYRTLQSKNKDIDDYEEKLFMKEITQDIIIGLLFTTIIFPIYGFNIEPVIRFDLVLSLSAILCGIDILFTIFYKHDIVPYSIYEKVEWINSA